MTIVQRLLDTAQMRTQYPEWLCNELESAAEEIARLQRKPMTEGQRRWLIEQAIQGHAGTRQAMDWLIRRVEAWHGANARIEPSRVANRLE